MVNTTICFGYDVGSSIVICIVKRFNLVKSTIIAYNTAFLANNAQIISKSPKILRLTKTPPRAPAALSPPSPHLTFPSPFPPYSTCTILKSISSYLQAECTVVTGGEHCSTKLERSLHSRGIRIGREHTGQQKLVYIRHSHGLRGVGWGSYDW